MPSAQITLFLDDNGKLHAEAPGKNGARCKLELNTPDCIVPSIDSIADAILDSALVIAENLIAQQNSIEQDKIEAKERANKLAQLRHERIIEYTAAHYPSALKFIDERALKPNSRMIRFLRSQEYTAAEIDLMASRGELVGTAFFTMPKFLRETSSEIPAKRAKREANKSDAEIIL